MMARRTANANARDWRVTGYFPAKEPVPSVDKMVGISKKVMIFMLNCLITMLMAAGTMIVTVGTISIVYQMVEWLFPLA